MKYKVHLVSDVVIDVEAESFCIYNNSYIFGKPGCVTDLHNSSRLLINNANYIFPTESVAYITKAD